MNTKFVQCVNCKFCEIPLIKRKNGTYQFDSNKENWICYHPLSNKTRIRKMAICPCV